MSSRDREFNMIVGKTKAGKSTYVANFVRAYPENVILFKHWSNIHDPAFLFLSEKTTGSWRQGAAPHQPVHCKIGGDKKSYRVFLKWVLTSYRNGALIIDDATILERDRLTEEMNELLTMKRHYGIDIYLVYHGISLLPIEQFVFVDYLVLFCCNDNFSYKGNKVPNLPVLQAAANEARANHMSEGPLKYEPVILKLS